MKVLEILICCISTMTLFFVHKVSLHCTEFVSEYLYAYFFSIVNLYLAIFNFFDYCVTGTEKVG